MLNAIRSVSLALCLLAAPLGAEAETVITGLVRSQGGQPLPGLALLEKGEIHNNRWDRGALVDAGGRFRIELAEGGQYGLHVYASGYLYKPNAVKVETGKTLEVKIELVPEPTRANDPGIKRVEFVPPESGKGRMRIKMDVFDPNGVYQFDVDPSERRDWHFTVADHKCNTADILGCPHQPTPAQVIKQ